MSVLMTEKREYVPRRARYQGQDDTSLRLSANVLRRELEDLHNRFDQATEPILVDSIIYEMQAVQMRYTYYLEMCKEQGIVSEEFTFSGV